jgi:CRISPR system Cascade subunit CasE
MVTDNLDIRDISVIQFRRGNRDVTIESALLTGVLHVRNREKFIYCFKNGIGKGKAFGLGLLQLAPLV